MTGRGPHGGLSRGHSRGVQETGWRGLRGGHGEEACSAAHRLVHGRLRDANEAAASPGLVLPADQVTAGDGQGEALG